MEGVYVKNKLNGEVKEYHESGELKFVGVYKEGLLSGHGIIYNKEGKKRFEGEFEGSK